MTFVNKYCRDDGPSSMYWAKGVVRGRVVVRGQ